MMKLLSALIMSNVLGLVLGDLFECPKSVGKAKNDVADYFDWFDRDHLSHKNLTDFRNNKYGGRATTYNKMKDKTRRFKKKVFGDLLQDGDIMFESAAGEGFNMLMTIELLKERGVENVTAYGNDYLAESVAVANRIFKQEVPGWKGKFCQGDSTDLSFVPSDTFDLVYTGAIDVLVDPLGLNEDEDATFSDMVDYSKELCNSDDPKDEELAAREQLFQEEWHNKWVKELLRIVKPGKHVIVEDGAYPICQDEVRSEWGGVAIEWWYEACKEYGWDVDPESIVIMLYPWYQDRYNVLMRRNPRDELPSVREE